MFVGVADEHPGRCLNHRTVRVGFEYKTLRCLDYENTEHICIFPDPPKPPPSSLNNSIYAEAAPKPWVRPGDE